MLTTFVAADRAQHDASIDSAQSAIAGLKAYLVYAAPPYITNYRLPTIAAIRFAFPKRYGIDYRVRYEDGRSHLVRDTDMWCSPNRRAKVEAFWSRGNRTLSARDICNQLTLPQYERLGGDFLRRMREDIRRGVVREPQGNYSRV